MPTLPCAAWALQQSRVSDGIHRLAHASGTPCTDVEEREGEVADTECGARKQTDRWVWTGPLKGHYVMLICRLANNHLGNHHDTVEKERWA